MRQIEKQQIQNSVRQDFLAEEIPEGLKLTLRALILRERELEAQELFYLETVDNYIN